MDDPHRRRAAIDIGTVTARLLVADTDGFQLDEVVRRTVVTHLGEGLHASGALSAAAMARVTDTVAGFAREIADTGATEIVAVATSASRDAANGRDLMDALAALGVRPRIISGSTEARLYFIGATYAIEEEDVLVADLGGGSTELVFGSAHADGRRRITDVDVARSLDVGSRRVLDMFLHSDPPSAAQLAEAASWVTAEMRPFFEALPRRPRELITLAGTGTTLSAIQQRLDVYDPAKVHGSRLSGGDVADLRDSLAGMKLADRRGVVGMDPERADVIVAGALILETIMALAGVDATVVSEHDILYGLVLEGA